MNRIFESIYNYSKNARLCEMSARVAYSKIKPELSKTINEPLNISEYGKKFNTYENEYFTDAMGNPIKALEFIKSIYSLAKADNYEPQKIKDALYYFLEPANKKFIIPNNYTYIDVKKKLLNGKEAVVRKDISRSASLDILLSDIIGGLESNLDIVDVTNKDNKNLLLFKRKKQPIPEEKLENTK